MATTSKNLKIVVADGDVVRELTGTELEEFESNRAIGHQEWLLLEAEYKAKQESRESAVKKLAEIAGLTKDELNAIL